MKLMTKNEAIEIAWMMEQCSVKPIGTPTVEGGWESVVVLSKTDPEFRTIYDRVCLLAYRMMETERADKKVAMDIINTFRPNEMIVLLEAARIGLAKNMSDVAIHNQNKWDSTEELHKSLRKALCYNEL